MKLGEYLEAIGLSATAFANSSGVARGTICHILAGGGCHARAAAKIVRATHGRVTLEDLIGEPAEGEAEGDAGEPVADAS